MMHRSSILSLDQLLIPNVAIENYWVTGEEEGKGRSQVDFEKAYDCGWGVSWIRC